MECLHENMMTSPTENTCTCLPGSSFRGTQCEACKQDSFRSQLMADKGIHDARIDILNKWVNDEELIEECSPCPANSTSAENGSMYCNCLNIHASNRTDEINVFLPDENCVPVKDFDCPPITHIGILYSIEVLKPFSICKNREHFR